jgi:putative SOS response-associated peptidase YedK
VRRYYKFESISLQRGVMQTIGSSPCDAEIIANTRKARTRVDRHGIAARQLSDDPLDRRRRAVDLGFFFGDHQRSLEVMRWGLIPFCAKDEKIGFSTINARAEEVDTKPAFREPFRQRRCLVPVENFYEWQKTGKGKQPYAVGLKRGGLMALAGLWDTWRSSAEERIRSFTIITTPRSSTTGCPQC